MASMVAAIVGIVAFIFKPVQDAIGNFIAEPMQDHLRYLCCFNDNVKDLEEEAPKLKDKRREVQSIVDRAQNNAEIVVPRVQTWLNKVSEIQTEKPKIDSQLNPTTNGGCSTVGCRYSVSKKVKKMAEAMKELRQESDAFTTIAHPPPPPAMVSVNIGSTIEFDSRKGIEEEIIASLRDKEINMVGICGMGGVGKTTMAKTIMYRSRKELGFQETVMVVVSQVVDKFKIQVDIAASLGLTLSAEGDLSFKAHELRMRLKASTRKSLIVIDDVWEKLQVEELGIPCNSDCKVVITSRNRNILEAMDVEKLHAMQILSETEAWELFKSKAGNCIEQENVVGVARQVVDECKGLPLALVTVGMALKNKATTPLWDDALKQLKSSNPSHMPEVIKDVYQPLRLSYDFLEGDDQKSLFLMCCLFPEDRHIPLETLANMSKGLLHMTEDIQSSRDATFALVERLKDRFLLLEGKDGNHVRMHDVVRDVAIFIAAEEKRIKCNECTWISPNIGERIGAHGRSSFFRNLHLLWIDCESRDKELEIHDDFFNGMRELKVIMIRSRSMLRLPKTRGLSTNLRTLVLENCVSLESIYVVGKLVNLEILICRNSWNMESLPVEIGRLSRLRLLELSRCGKLKRIAPGIISNLSKLEELIVEEFDGWEARTVEGERKNAPLCELEHLPSLSLVKIKISDYELAAEQLRLSLKKFHITLGCESTLVNLSFKRISEFPITLGCESTLVNLSFKRISEKTLILELGRDIILGKWIDKCVRNVESLHLLGEGSKSVLDLPVALNLKLLDICGCSRVKNLVNTPFLQLEDLSLVRLGELEEICDISNLKKLSSIRIEECGSLRSLFSLTAIESGGCFLQLEKLEIDKCVMMEQVLMVRNEEEENQTNIHIPLLLFPKLNYLSLCSLPRFTSFIKGFHQVTEFPQLDEITIEDCPLLKEFVCSGSPADQHGDDNDSLHLYSRDPHKVKFGKLRKLQLTQGSRNLYLQAPIDSFTSLTSLTVSGLNDMKSLFSFSMSESSCLSQLERLVIEQCDMMEQVIMWKEEENQMDIHIMTQLFPKLKYLRLSHLPRLTSLMSNGIENILFPLPYQTYILNCPLLGERCAAEIGDENDDCRHLFCKPHHKVEFDRLKVLYITGSYDDKMRRNWCPQIPMIELFSGLCELDVWCLKGMESLFPCSIARMMKNINTLMIFRCKEMVRVIEDDNAENETQTQTTTPVLLLFPNLKRLRLHHLPELRSFCEWRSGLELPLLSHMKIDECGMMEELTLGPLITPNLQTLRIDVKLNPSSFKLVVQKKGLLPPFQNLRYLPFNFCDLPEVEMLQIDVNSALQLYKIKKQIIIARQTKEEIEGLLDHLKEQGINLDTQINLRPQIQTIELFARLCRLDVWGLKGTESLFPCSIARMMQHIKTLKISRCEEMIRVIEDHAEIETQTLTTPPILLFPKLEHLYLIGLPKLRSFCEWRCGLHLPSLLRITFEDCDTSEELTSGPLYAPRLEM